MPAFLFVYSTCLFDQQRSNCAACADNRTYLHRAQRFDPGSTVVMPHHIGRVELICGSMFCGKTEELIRRVRRAIIGKQQVQVFKPSLDDRFGIESVTSHDGQTIHARPIVLPSEIFALLEPTTTVIAIDEVQFFDASIVDVVETLAGQGLRVVLAGLDMD
ncbi:MAG: hypothetical protein NZM00_02425, partial [Anaerolinea sp.]|nr:hypothetical protein [Anaerolinea sp.]